MHKICQICGWELSNETEEHICIECAKVVCTSCYTSGGFSVQDRYDIIKQIDPPSDILVDLEQMLSAGVDPRAKLCVECLQKNFVRQYIGVIRYGSSSG